MEKVLLRFGHIGIQIFEQLDNVTTTNCRIVTKSWQTFMDNERVSSFQMIKFMTNVADAYLRKFLMKRDPEHCMELAKCVYFIYDNYPADWKFPSYQSNPSKQLYIMQGRSKVPKSCGDNCQKYSGAPPAWRTRPS